MKKSKEHLPVLEIVRINLRHNSYLSIMVSVVLLMITPVIFGTSNLDQVASAVPLEMFVSLIGIVLLTPVFQPEQNDEIADVVLPKRVSADIIYLTRTVYLSVSLIALIVLFGAYMKIQKSDVTLLLLMGTVANAVFLGSLGMFTAALSDNTIIAYMIPLIYYIMNYGAGRKLGNYDLFSMRILHFQPKIWLFTTGILLVFASLLIKRLKRKIPGPWS